MSNLNKKETFNCYKHFNNLPDKGPGIIQAIIDPLNAELRKYREQPYNGSTLIEFHCKFSKNTVLMAFLACLAKSDKLPVSAPGIEKGKPIQSIEIVEGAFKAFKDYYLANTKAVDSHDLSDFDDAVADLKKVNQFCDPMERQDQKIDLNKASPVAITVLRYGTVIILSFLKCDIKQKQPPDAVVAEPIDSVTSLPTANRTAFAFIGLLIIAVVCRLIVGPFLVQTMDGLLMSY